MEPRYGGRFDDRRIVFRSLTQDQLAAIVDIQLCRLEKRLAERRIQFVVTDAARNVLAQRGWDPDYGARPLKRMIQRLGQDPLAMMLLEGKFSDGDTVEVDVRNGELALNKSRVATPAALSGCPLNHSRLRAGSPVRRKREVDQVIVLCGR